MPQRLVVQVADPGVDFEVLQKVQDLGRGSGQDRERDTRMLGLKGGRQTRHDGQRRRDHRDSQMADDAEFRSREVLPHGLGVRHDAARPFEDPFALRREALEARRPMDQENPERVLQGFQPRREGRLSDPASLRGPPEMPFARQCQQELELIDHDGSDADVSSGEQDEGLGERDPNAPE